MPLCINKTEYKSPSLSLSYTMKVLELEDPACRFRLAHSFVGLLGCLCVAYAVWTPQWLGDQGLWAEWNNTENDQTGDVSDHTEDFLFNALEAERVFGVIAFLMAVSSGALCLVFALCWTSQTVRSYSNTRSLLMVGQALYPTTLLLLTLGPTGFFFLLSWSLFTYQHWVDISQDFTCLGSSYWLGVLGWALLLVVLPVVFLVEQCVVPDILPDLMKAAESWRRPTELPYTIRSFSEGHHPGKKDDDNSLRRYMSVP